MSLVEADKKRLEKILEECREFEWEIEEGDALDFKFSPEGMSLTHIIHLPWINVYIPGTSGEAFDWVMHVLGLMIRAYLCTEDQKNRAFVTIPSDTPDVLRHYVISNSDPLESFTPADRRVNSVLTVDTLPCKAPWLAPNGACLVIIYAMTRDVASGGVLFGIGVEKPPPVDKLRWVKANAFYTEWPD